MKSNKKMCRLVAGLVTAVGAVATTGLAAEPSNAGFTYQGQLKHQGVPVNGEGRFSFTLWDAEVDGRQIGSAVETRIQIVNGLFTAQLDFGSDAFRREPRWLEIVVATEQGEGRLSPRQPITPAPFALYALDAPGGGGTLTLPFAGTNTTNETAIAVTNSGLAPAAVFVTDNASNTQAAVTATTTGSGPGLLAMTGGSGPAVWGLTGNGGGLAGLFRVQGTSATQTALGAENSAMGSAGHFKTTKRENTNPALVVETFADGSAATFTTHSDPNNANFAPTVTSDNHSFGSAGQFSLSNHLSIADALSINTIASGNALHVYTNGSGRAGLFEVNNFGVRTIPAVEVISNGRGGAAGLFKTTNGLNTATALVAEASGNAGAIQGIAKGTGTAVTGYNAFGGNAVVGLVEGATGKAGSFKILEATNTEPAVEAVTNGTGPAGLFDNTNTTVDGIGVHVKGRGRATGAAALRVENLNTDNGVAIFASNNSPAVSLAVKNSGTGHLLRGYRSSGGVSFEVDNDGNVSAGSYHYNTPREGKFSVDAIEFITRTRVDDSTFYVAGVHLPNGAVLTEMKVFFVDSSASHDLVFKLEGTSLIDGALHTLASMQTTGTPGVSSLTTSSFVEPIIDNDANCHYLYVERIDSIARTSSSQDSTERDALSFTYTLGFVFTYTVTEAD